MFSRAAPLEVTEWDLERRFGKFSRLANQFDGSLEEEKRLVARTGIEPVFQP